MMSFFRSVFEQYKENKLVIGLLGIVLGAVLTRFIPFLWTFFSNALAWIGKRIGGRFAFRDFERSYLDWVITEHSELKLTGIVTSDEAKKPKLEQVFVSLQIAKQKTSEPTDKMQFLDVNLQGTIPTWTDLREILQLQEGMMKGSNEKKLIRHHRNAIGRLKLISKLDAVRANCNKLIKNVSWLRPLRVSIDSDVRLRWATAHKDVFQDAVGAFQLKTILNTQQRIAILGTPGAGKTTLLQHIALAHARERAADPKLRRRGSLKQLGAKKWRLPIFIRLSSIAGMLLDTSDNDKSPSILEILPRILPPDLQDDTVAKNYFRQELTNGNCLVLLDGLDEVPTDIEFQAVIRAIESMIVKFGPNQFVITSRIAGWRSGVNGDFEIYYVNELSDHQVSTFIDTWYSAVERNNVVGRLKDEGSAERKARERRASQKANDLKHTLKENIGIRRLATNPMLLSIIALVHRSLATLPKERGKLYAQCSRILLEQWDISRGVRVDDTNLKLEQKEAIMRRLAVAYHTGEIGDKSGGREASRVEVGNIIAEMLPSLGMSADDAAHLLQMLIERSGILVERRRDVLTFGHHTFQEYFTAQFFAIGENLNHRNYLLRPEHLMSDWWHEVLLLYSGLLSDSGDFIRMIHEQVGDDLCQKRLRLATLCLHEAIRVEKTEVRKVIGAEVLKVRSGGNPINSNLTALPEVLDYLVSWSKSEDWFSNAARAKVKFMNENAHSSEIERQVLSSLDDEQHIIRQAAIQSLSSLDVRSVTTQLQSRIFSLLRDEDTSIRVTILNSLGRIDWSQWAVDIDRSLFAALSDKQPVVRVAALNALRTRQPAAGCKSFLEDFSKMLQSEDSADRQTAVLALPFLENGLENDQIQAFVDLIDDPDYRVPEVMQQIIGRLSNEHIITALWNYALLCFDDRKRAAHKYFGHILLYELNLAPIVSDHVIDNLFRLLRVRESTDAAAIAIRNLAAKSSSSKVAARIAQELQETTGRERTATIELVGSIGEALAQTPIIEILLSQLKDYDPGVRQSTAIALSIANKADCRRAVIQELLQLTKDSFVGVRVSALHSLKSFAEAGLDEEVCRSIVSGINDPKFSVRLAAADAIGSMKTIPDAETLIEPLSAMTRRLFSLNRFSRRFLYRSPVFRHTLYGREALYIPQHRFGAQFSPGSIPSVIDALLNVGCQSDPERVLAEIMKAFKRASSDRNARRRFVFDYLYLQRGDNEREFSLENQVAVDEQGSNIQFALKSSRPDRKSPSYVERTLIRIGQHVSPSVMRKVLIDELSGDSTRWRVVALRVIAGLGWKAAGDGVAEWVLNAMDDKDKEVAASAIETAVALVQTERHEAILHALLKKLRDVDPAVQEKAWESLQQVQL